MAYFNLVFPVILILVIVGFAIQLYRADVRANKAEMAKWQAEAEASVLTYENQALRSYMDNRHMVWDPLESRRFLEKPPSDKGLVILINAMDLFELYHNQWVDGHVMSSMENTRIELMRTAAEVEKELDAAENVHRFRHSFGDRRFDGDVREFVNELTKIASRFGQTQQLRARISSQVMSFREYMTKRLAGEKAIFHREGSED